MSWYGALYSGSKGTGGVAASTTLYGVPLNGTQTNAVGLTTEAEAQVPIRTTGYFSGLSIVVMTNDRGASTFKFRKGGANGNQSVSITSSGTGRFTDSTHTDSVTAGDLVDTQLITGSGGSNFVHRICQVVFFSPNAVMRYGAANQGSSSGVASTTILQALAGVWTSDNTETEANLQTKMKTAGTWRNFYIYVTSSTRSSTTTYKNRINGADGTLAMSVVASATGAFEDTTHSDSVSVGDLLNFAITTGSAGGGVTVNDYASEFESTTAAQMVTATGAPTLISPSTTVYFGWGNIPNSSTESQISLDAQQTATISKLSCYLKLNDITSAPSVTITFRKNAADGTQAISVGNSATGYFEDASGTDSVASGDLMAIKFVTAATGTGIRLSNASVLYSPSGVAPPSSGGVVTRRFVGMGR